MHIEFISFWQTELGQPERPCTQAGSKSRSFVSDEAWSLIRVERGGYGISQEPFQAEVGPGDFHLGLPHLHTLLTGNPACPEPTRASGLRFLVRETPEPLEFWRLLGVLPGAAIQKTDAPAPVVFAGLEDGLWQVFDQALAEGARREPGWECAVEGLLQAALVRFGRAWVRQGGVARAGRGPVARERRALQAARERVRLLDGYMDRNLDHKISMDDLCRVVNLSRQRLLEVYRTAKGLPPWEALLSKRLDRARALLADASRPVKEVAGSVGFKDPAYFTRVFARRMGCPPAEFQRRAANPTCADSL